MIQDADRLFREYMKALGWLGDPGLFELVRTHVVKVPVENVSALLAGDSGIPELADFLAGIRDRDLGGDPLTINGYFGELLRYLDYDVELLGGAIAGDPLAHALLRVSDEGRTYLIDVGLGAPIYEPIAVDALPHRVECGDWVYTIASEGGGFVVTTTVAGGSTTRCVVDPKPRELAELRDHRARPPRPSAPEPAPLAITRIFAAARVARITGATLILTQHNQTRREPLADPEALARAVVDELQLHNLPVDDALAALAARGTPLFTS